MANTQAGVRTLEDALTTAARVCGVRETLRYGRKKSMR